MPNLLEKTLLLMHGNARLYTTRITQQFLNDVNISLPAVSPDVNPIELELNISQLILEMPRRILKL